MMKKISLFLGVLFLDLTAFLISSTCVSLSWFNKGFNINFDNQTGKSLANYFASGDGSKGKPYTITESIHFYNFAWLQYLGEFNKNATGSDSVEQKYFKLGKDVDMTGLVVPPVGTIANPFVGNFDGNDKTINNLIVSNSFNDFGTKHPSVVNAGNFETINIVGTFGVVGNLSTNFKYNSTINEVMNLYLDNVTLKTNTPNLLVGIFAGYVNGKINNCGVHYSKIEIANKTQYYLTNNEIVDKYIDKKISNYTLLGAYNNTDYYWDGEPGFGGSGPDFGGSISMLALNRRINYIAAITKAENRESTIFNNANYRLNLVLGTGYKEPYWKDPGATIFTYLNDGTCLPINIDESTAFAGDEIISKANKRHTSNFYSSNTSEDGLIKSNNTGYLIGGNNKGQTSGYVRTRMQPIDKALVNSYVAPTEENKDFSINVYTIDTTSENPIIKLITPKEEQKLSRYNVVKPQFDETMSTSKYVHGFHFMDCIEPNNLSKGVFKDIYLGGEKYENYEMVKGALNFKITKAGFITTMLGTYYPNAQTAESIFDLFKVERNANNEIQSVKRIYKIYKNANDINYSYTKQGEENLGELVFDFTKANGTLSKNRAIYFEIPVTEGDYLIGRDRSAKDDNAYLMYLDIGANASSDEEKRTALKNVDFVDAVEENGKKTLNKVDPINLSKVAFKISGTFDTNYIYCFRRKGNTVYYYSSVTAFGFITPSSTGEKKKASGEACES